jgi:hypothetical protein
MYRDAHPEGEEEQRAGVLLLDFANPHLQHNVSESRRAQGLKPPAAHKVDGMRSRPDRVQQEFPRCIVVSCSSSVISVRYPRGEWISDHRLRQIVEHRRGGREPLGTIAALDAELPPLKSQQQADHWVALSDVLECLDLPESVARASEARMMPIVVLCSAHATVGAFQSVFRVPTHFIGRSSGSLDEVFLLFCSASMSLFARVARACNIEDSARPLSGRVRGLSGCELNSSGADGAGLRTCHGKRSTKLG